MNNPFRKWKDDWIIQRWTPLMMDRDRIDLRLQLQVKVNDDSKDYHVINWIQSKGYCRFVKKNHRKEQLFIYCECFPRTCLMATKDCSYRVEWWRKVFNKPFSHRHGNQSGWISWNWRFSGNGTQAKWIRLCSLLGRKIIQREVDL